MEIMASMYKESEDTNPPAARWVDIPESDDDAAIDIAAEEFKEEASEEDTAEECFEENDEDVIYSKDTKG